NFQSILVGTEDPKKLGEFYQKILDKKPDMQEETWWGFMIGSTFLSIGFHSEIKGQSKEPARIILNFETKEVREEFARMKGAGATVIKEPYEMGGAWIATLADPDGNYFQIMTPWEDVQGQEK